MALWGVFLHQLVEFYQHFNVWPLVGASDQQLLAPAGLTRFFEVDAEFLSFLLYLPCQPFSRIYSEISQFSNQPKARATQHNMSERTRAVSDDVKMMITNFKAWNSFSSSHTHTGKDRGCHGDSHLALLITTTLLVSECKSDWALFCHPVVRSGITRCRRISGKNIKYSWNLWSASNFSTMHIQSSVLQEILSSH